VLIIIVAGGVFSEGYVLIKDDSICSNLGISAIFAEGYGMRIPLEVNDSLGWAAALPFVGADRRL
jgi:hypothetical protein